MGDDLDALMDWAHDAGTLTRWETVRAYSNVTCHRVHITMPDGRKARLGHTLDDAARLLLQELTEQAEPAKQAA